MNSQSLAGRLVRGDSLPARSPRLVWAGMQMSQDIWMHMLQRTEDAPGDRCTAARCRVNTDRSFNALAQAARAAGGAAVSRSVNATAPRSNSHSGRDVGFVVAI